MATMTDSGFRTPSAPSEKQMNRSDPPSPRVKGSPKIYASQSIQDLEKANFHLTEQVNDLKYQLSSKQDENNKLQETLSSKSSEYEEKMKKMREIFAQATKNLDGYRATIAAKDTEIKQLREDLTQHQAREQDLQSMVETQTRNAETLAAELNNYKASSLSQIKQSEAKIKLLTTQHQQLKTEYDQYKKRATQLLKSKTAEDNRSKLDELEMNLKQAQLEKAELEATVSDYQRRIQLLEQDVRQALERIDHLQSENASLSEMDETNTSRLQQLERIRDELTKTVATHEKTIQHMTREHEKTLQELRELRELQTVKETQPLDKNTEQEVGNSSDQALAELQRKNIMLREQIEDLEFELATLKSTTNHAITDNNSNSDGSNNDGKNTHAEDNTTPVAQEQQAISTDVYSSITHLLSPLVGNTQSQNEVDMERKIARLSELLAESEEKVNALKAQEKVLKDEIRKLDAFDRRQNLSVEYLKNVLLKFLKSDNKEFMVPVLAKLLSLDKNETEELRKATLL